VDSVGERLQAVVEQVLGPARQDDVQGREPPAARVAVALPEGEGAADGAVGSLPDTAPGVALVVLDLFGEAGLGHADPGDADRPARVSTPDGNPPRPAGRHASQPGIRGYLPALVQNWRGANPSRRSQCSV
jgi:hypothetical protein